MDPENLMDAAEVKPGDWIVERSGWYRVDSVAVSNGLAHIGTQHGVLVLPATAPVLVAGGDA